ncbi:hypothetical protein LY76DRAFT_603081 [Colletotrichum caudatum]|nr:hypothetical protein LY76DRAFT_603081 [Colletotrichum caudatum]
MEEEMGRKVVCRATQTDNAGQDIMAGLFEDWFRAMFGDEGADNAKNNLWSSPVAGSAAGSAASRAVAPSPMANMAEPGLGMSSGTGHHHRSGKSLSKRPRPNPTKPNGSIRPPRNHALRGGDGVMHCLAVRRTRSASQGSKKYLEESAKSRAKALHEWATGMEDATRIASQQAALEGVEAQANPMKANGSMGTPKANDGRSPLSCVLREDGGIMHGLVGPTRCCAQPGLHL